MRFLTLTLFVLIMLASAAPTAAQNPPKGDNYQQPIKIVPNTQKTVKNVQYASLQAPSIELTACDADNSSDNSVWFRFVMPRGGSVDLDSSGSVLNSTLSSHSYVTLSLYDAASLNERRCETDNGARILDTVLPAGEYLVRIASDGDYPNGPSQYRLSLRIRSLLGMGKNANFENATPGEFWAIRRAGSPPKVTFVCITDCGVRFNGATKGKVLQNVKFEKSELRFKKGDMVNATAYINSTGPSGSNVRMILKIVYNDGTPQTISKQTRHITHTSTTTSTNFGGVYAEIASKAVKKFQVTIMSPDAIDIFTVSSTTMNMTSGFSVRQHGLISVPPAPSGW